MPIRFVKTEIFEWTSADKTCKILFDVSRMLDDMAFGNLSYDLVEAPLDIDWVREWLLPHRDLNFDYIRNMPEHQYNIPLLGVNMPDHTVLIIDGSHRYAKRFIKHLTTISVRIIDLGKWERYATISGELPKAPTP